MRTRLSLRQTLGWLAIAAAALLLASGWAFLALCIMFGALEAETWSPYPAWIVSAPFLLTRLVLPSTVAPIAALLLIVAACLGMVLHLRALVRSRGTARRRLLAHTGFALLALAVLVWTSHALTLRANRLAHVPPALEVTRILHARERVWGFGPGGNEVGVIVYALPPHAGNRVRQGGIAFLEGLREERPRAPDEWQGEYFDWAETPIRPGQRWTPRDCAHSGTDDCARPRLRHYLGSWGSMMGVDPDVERAVDDAVNHTGSYYAWARIGMILVVPAQGRVYYLYQG